MRELAQRNFRVTGSVQTVLNAVFVIAPPSQVNELLALPGVKGIAPLRRYKLQLNKAVGLEDIPAAWTALGGESNAGAGVKIALIDTGVDITAPLSRIPRCNFRRVSRRFAHSSPSLVTPTLRACPRNRLVRQFTNNKVIIARSYVAEVASGLSLRTEPRGPTTSRRAIASVMAPPTP